MACYNGYNIFRNYSASSPKEYLKTTLQQRIDRDFSDTLDVYTVKIKNRITSEFSDLTVRVVTYGQEFSFFSHDDYKKIVFQDLDYNVYMGDIFEFSGYRWIVVQAKTKESTSSSCVVQRCNTILKFTESTPITENIIEIDCVAENRIHDSANDSYIDLPSGKLQIIMPYDQDSIKIRVSPKPTRFLIGLADWRGQVKAWEVENIDTIQYLRQDLYASTPSTYAGSLRVDLRETQYDNVRDDSSVGVAWQRYFGR